MVKKAEVSDRARKSTKEGIAELTKGGLGSVEGVPGSDGEGEGLVGSRGIGDTGGDGHVVLNRLDDEVGAAVGGDDSGLVVELGREADDEVGVLGVESASSSVAVLCRRMRLGSASKFENDGKVELGDRKSDTHGCSRRRRWSGWCWGGREQPQR